MTGPTTPPAGMSERRACEWMFLTEAGEVMIAITRFREGVAAQRALAAVVEMDYDTDEEAWKDFLALRNAQELTVQ